MALPYTIKTIVQQMGGFGINGAFTYIGATDFTHRHPDYYTDCECRGSSKVVGRGEVFFDVGVQFNVNGPDGEDWMMFVTYEADDTYTVRLTGIYNKQTGERNVIDKRYQAYCDNLQDIVEEMYDRCMAEFAPTKLAELNILCGGKNP